MKYYRISILLIFLFGCMLPVDASQTKSDGDNSDNKAELNNSDQVDNNKVLINKILSDIQFRYQNLKSLSCLFKADSTNSMTGMIDKVYGKLWIDFPGKMRWEYKVPKQTVIYDGKQLIIYYEEENQVFAGPGDSVNGINLIFKFFSDTPKIKEQFRVVLEDTKEKLEESEQYQLRLFPDSIGLGIDEITIGWDASENWITQMKILDSIGNDVTYYFRSFLKNPRLKRNLFKFKYPKNAEIYDLDGTLLENPKK